MASVKNAPLFLLLTVCSISLQWTASAANCPALQKPANGNMGPNCDKPAPPGHICRFMCDDGYFLEDSEERKCKSNGEWSKTTPTCVPTCPALQEPPNGTMEGRCWRKPIAPNSECIFSCDRGFYRRGVFVLTCQDDSKWDYEPPTCERTCVGVPKPYKGNMTGKCSGEVKIGDVCSLTCQDGYFMKGPKEITCQADYEWTDEPPACVNSCPDLGEGCNGFKPFDRCIMTCPPGRFLEGKAVVTCEEDFEWNTKDLPHCVEVCPVVTQPSNGFTSGNCSGKLTTGDKCTFGCNEGFLLKGEKEIICQEDRKWNKNPPLCVNTCPAVSVAGAERLEGKCGGSAKAEEKCTVSCPKDYVRRGDGDLVCNKDFEWNKPFPTCVNSCGAVSVAGADDMKGQCNGSAKVGDKCIVSCPEGSVLRGDKELVCIQDFEWNKPIPTCEVLQCSKRAFLVEAWNANLTWNEYCETLQRECTEPGDGQPFTGCGPCIAGFQEVPELAGKPGKSCIAKTKCNEVQSGTTSWTRYCASLRRVCNEPATSETTARCGQCLENFVEDPTQAGNLDKACTVRTECTGPYELSLADGPTWKQHCAGQNKECTARSGVNCGNCLPGFRPGRWPSDPCVNTLWQRQQNRREAAGAIPQPPPQLLVSGTNGIVSRLRTILLKPDLVFIHEEESFRVPN